MRNQGPGANCVPIDIQLGYNQRGVIEGAMLYLIVGLAVALAASLAAGAGTAWYLDGKVDQATARATKAEGARAAEEQSRLGFQAAAGACSASLDVLQKAGEARDRERAKALYASQEATATAEEEVKRLLQRTRPAGMDECTAARKELDDEVDRRHRR